MTLAQNLKEQEIYFDSLEQQLPLMEKDELFINNVIDLAMFSHTSNPEKTLSLALEQLPLAEELGYDIGVVELKTTIGIAHDVKGDILQASKYYSDALEQAIYIKDTFSISNIALNFGILLRKQERYDQALKQFNLALDWEEDQDSYEAYLVKSNLAALYVKMDSIEQAKSYVEYCMGVAEAEKDTFLLSYVYLTQGQIDEKEGRLDQAIEHLMKALAFAELTNNTENIGDVNIYLSDVYYKKEDYQTAFEYADKASTSAQQLGSKFQVLQTYKALAKSCSKLGHYEEAAKAYNNYEYCRDSIYKAGKLLMQEEIEHSLEVKNELIENTVLKSTNQSLVRQRLALVLIAFLVILAIVILARSMGLKRKYTKLLEDEVQLKTIQLKQKNEELVSSNKELENFVYIASHDLKEPLRNMSNFSTLMEKKYANQLEEEGLEYLGYIKGGAKQLNSLIEDVLEYSRLGQHHTKGNVDLNILLEMIQLKVMANRDGVDKVMMFDELPAINANHEHMKLLFSNIIENGYRYNESSEKRVDVKYGGHKDGKHHFAIQDNGLGIKPEFRNKIFEMFKRLHHRTKYEGTGIGLALCKKIVESYNGEIGMEPRPEGGTIITFSLQIEE